MKYFKFAMVGVFLGQAILLVITPAPIPSWVLSIYCIALAVHNFSDGIREK